MRYMRTFIVAGLVAAVAACDVSDTTPAEPAPVAAAPVAAAPPPPALPALTGDTLQRHNDLLKVQAALEKYAAAHSGAYPVSKDFQGFISAWGPSLGANWIPELLPDYIDALPRDPANATTTEGSIYIYKSDGKDYKLLVHGYGDCSPAVEQDGIKIDPGRTKDGACWAYGIWSANGGLF